MQHERRRTVGPEEPAWWSAAGWWAELADLVWPATCPGCGTGGAGTAPACRTCLLVFTAAASPTAPTPRPSWLPPLWAVADYHGSARAVIIAYKEHGTRGLAAPLGTALADGLSAALATCGPNLSAGRPRRPCLVVPMPSGVMARRARGEDPTLRLVRVAVRRLRTRGVPATVLPALEQLPGVLDQAGLSAAERMRNLSGALRVRPRAQRELAGASAVLLADDIVTTGATLAAASRVLQAQDCAVAGAAVIAATRRRSAGAAGPRQLVGA